MLRFPADPQTRLDADRNDLSAQQAMRLAVNLSIHSIS